MKNPAIFFLVDDDLVMTYVNKTMIEMINSEFEIVEHLSSTKALKDLKNRQKENLPPPNYIFLDINMPELNGFQFLDKLKPLEKEYLKETNLFILTSSLDERDKEKAKEYPFVKKFIGKPLSGELIKSLIKEFH